MFFLPDWWVTAGRWSGHAVVERLGPEAAAHHQDPQRAFAPVEAGLRRRHREDLLAHRVTGHAGLAGGAAEIGREAEQHALRQRGQGFVRQQQRGIGIDQRERNAAQARHHAARDRDIAAHPQRHARFAARHDAQAGGEAGGQLEGAGQRVLQALAAHAGEIDRIEFDAVLRHDVLLHPERGAEPAHFPAARAHGLRDRDAGEDMPAGAGGHDDQAPGHGRPPRISTRFS
jgi:hypothetical protein